ncbi:unnamed protein product [Bursaphelenchus okinawaensis]|uniref:CN hydrolase domain-containing protein n=1 Tax=Bursaphelenchus okinawaensis TaxID=465554 RepID=A0A811KE20_9BILA|nr:unnamed protein product [Bursaphelenchus okinawaensis]CAG9102739.1 unnamed protein product [Bursaphelenchus okinawaensis]
MKRMVRVAVVQHGPVLYDTPKTIDKVRELTRKAASDGAELVLFPADSERGRLGIFSSTFSEAFIGGYIKGETFGISMGKRSEEGRDEFKRYFKSAIEYGGQESEQLASIASEFNVILVIGVVEREGGTLYCAVFFYSEAGEHLGKHRKLIPTALERCVWGQGDGSTIDTINTKVGTIGAAICWENYMPLLRFSMYRDGVQIYLAPTVDDRDVWLPTMTTIALEGRCFVVSACQFMTSADFSQDHESYKAVNEDGSANVLIRGGSCVVSPLGKVLVQPVFNKAVVHVVDLDMDEIIRGKFDLDTVGHYNRPDVFQLTVKKQKL